MMKMAAGKFQHHMIREIFEEPRVIRDTLGFCERKLRNVMEEIKPSRFGMIYVTGSGTSYHAGLAGQYALSSLAGLATSLIPASEFPTWIPPSAKDFLLIAFSQSGESRDILAATEAAVDKGAEVLAVTNTQDSSLAKTAKFALITQAGKEQAVTATKTYVAQLAAIYQLSVELGEGLKKILQIDLTELRSSLEKAANFVEETLKTQNSVVREIANKYRKNSFFFLLGSGPNYATALEGALKLKESCNIFAEGYASREFLHGPMQLVNEKTPMFFIVSPGDSVEEWATLMNRFRKFGAPVISIACEDKEIVESSTDSIFIPKGLPPVFSPMLYVVPLQLFSYYSSIARGLNPDRPEKLSKVVK